MSSHRAAPRLRRSFAWSFVSNSVYSFTQWLMLVVLARLADPTAVGEFALTLAVAAPVFMALGMNLRVVQATDAAQDWTLEVCLALRHLLNLVAVAVTMLVGLLIGMSTDHLLTLAAVCGAKVVENVSQTYYGFFQQHEHHDYVAQSMLVRSVLGPGLFALLFAASHELSVAACGLLLGWAVPQQFLDRPRGRALRRAAGAPLGPLWPVPWRVLWALAVTSAPLGADQGVSSLSVNIPRFVVQGHYGSATLGVYSALSYIAQIISMVTSALGIVVMPRLAKYYKAGKRRAFVRLLVLQTLASLLVVVVVLLGTVVGGRWFVEVTLGRDYVDMPLLYALVISAWAITLQRCIGRGLASSRHFVTFLVIDSVTALGVWGASLVFVPWWGLDGAAWASTCGFLLGSLVSVVAVVRLVRAMEPAPAGQRDAREASAG